MNSKSLLMKNVGQEVTLWEMRECLLILQNSHVTITTILQKMGNGSRMVNANMIEILNEEILQMNLEIERMHESIQKQITQTIQSS